MISRTSRRMMNLSNQLVYANSSSNNIDYVEAPLPKVVLNKPKVLNSLNTQMIHSLAQLLPKLRESPAFWMEGAGGKAFCAGGDVKNLFEGQDAGYDKREAFFRNQFTLDYHLSQLNSVQIANWDGIVMGGGVGVSIFAPFRIATESTMLAMPEAKIGFFTDVGVSYQLSRLRNNIGMYIALTSGRLKGQDVYNSGFANYFVAKDSVSKIYQQISKTIRDSKNPKQTISQILDKYNIGNPNKQIANEEEINHIFSGNCVHQIFERAKNSNTQFGKSVVKAMEDVCPLSVHVIHRLVKESVNMDVKEVFMRDFIVAQHYSANKNFEVGVRSLLIEKTNNPQWTHKHLQDISDKEVDQVFTAHPERKQLQI